LGLAIGGVFYYFYTIPAKAVEIKSESSTDAILKTETVSKISEDDVGLKLDLLLKKSKQKNENLETKSNISTVKNTKLIMPTSDNRIADKAPDIPVQETISLHTPQIKQKETTPSSTKQDLVLQQIQISDSLPKEVVVESKVEEPKKPKKPLVMKVDSFSQEETLLRKFDSFGDFESALGLAEFYFDSKEYEKAIVWAKKSSKMNPSSDKPWLIYAQSKYNSGDKDEAIKSLETFMSFSASFEVKKLLEKLRGQLQK
ncbi:MAG: CDC27 family protein, partial [Sulfurospirillaceae bacterium]|nr:CDC27 family protein [Sulfurospirillaceae bacterium]